MFGILLFILYQGIGVISWEFVFGYPTDGMTKGGILPAIVGTLVLVLGSIVLAFPIGICSAIYLNEYQKDNRVKRIISLMTNNLAGLPSIVFGMFGMALFVNELGFGDSILAGSFTLALLIVPMVIRTTEDALKTIPNSHRLMSYSLGASKWQTIKNVIFPEALPDIVSGLLLAVGRLSGETAPILFTVAAYFLPKLPHSIFDQVMALPYHLYALSTSGINIEASRKMAYGTALVLVLIILFINILSARMRKYLSRKIQENKQAI